MTDTVIYEDKFFQVISPAFPLNCREDGGHLILLKKEIINDRSDMSWQEGIGFMRISMIVGQAMYEVLEIERINYEDLGNWGIDKPQGSYMHLHFFGRSAHSIHQIRGNHLLIYPEGHNIYKGHLTPLNKEETDQLIIAVNEISKEEKYKKMAELASI